MNPRVLPFFTPRSLIQNMCTQEPRDLLTLYGQAATAVTRLVSHAAWPHFRNSHQGPNLSSPQTNPPFSSQMQFFHSRVLLTGYAKKKPKKLSSSGILPTLFIHAEFQQETSYNVLLANGKHFTVDLDYVRRAGRGVTKQVVTGFWSFQFLGGMQPQRSFDAGSLTS